MNKWRLTFLLLAALNVAPAPAADPPPGVQCDGIYCRETVDRDWYVRISGEVVSPAGVYVVVTGLEGKVIFRGKIPNGRYPPESPYRVKVPKDGVAGDYLLTLFGTQADFAGLRTPYTDLPFEVYGKEVNGRTFLRVIPQGPARDRPLIPLVAGSLYFQVTAGAEELTIRQGRPWSIHALDGSMVFDAAKQGKMEGKTCTATFRGTPGTTYVLGHSLYWFFASPRLYVAISPERWFLPDPRLQLNPGWWRQTK